MSSLLDALIAAEEFPPLKGDRGPKGDVGDKGDKGDTGYQGPEGPTGPMGPDGPEGPGGPEGPEGKRGPKGLKGDDGEKGDKGDEGPAGRDGGVAGGRSYNVRGFASGMVIDDEGTKLNSGAVVGEIDFVGSGVSTAIVGSKAVVTVTGGSGLPSGGTVGQVVTNTGPGAGDWEDAPASTGLPPQWTDGGNGNVTATVDAINKTAITVRALAGQTAPLVDVRDENDLSIEKLVQENGGIGATKTFGLAGAKMEVLLDNQAGVFQEVTQRISVSGDGTLLGWFLDVFTDNVDATQSFTQAILTVANLQTIPVLRVKSNVTNALLFQVLASGAIVTAAHAAPADGDLAAGEMATWFDQTNGASAMKIKAKQADGTVVTATVPLT